MIRHGPEWDRLTDAHPKRGALTGAEADELVDLYPRVATQLSVIRSRPPTRCWRRGCRRWWRRPAAWSPVSPLPLWRSVGLFFVATFPAAVYRARRWWIPVAVINIAVAALIAWRVINTPGLADTLLSDSAARRLVDHDFAAYYSENPAADFALQVWLNNARVAAVCLVLGIAIAPRDRRVVGQRLEPRGDRRFHDRRGPGRRVLRADPAARTARADDHLRGRRRRSAARLELDRARSAHPDRRRWPPRAARSAPSRWGSRSGC